MPSTLLTARDIPLSITSTASSSERRITPSWTLAHLKAKLEPVTGIPPSSQLLSLRLPDQQDDIAIRAEDEDSVEIGQWPLVPYAELKVTASGNAAMSTFPSLSSVPKYTMPSSAYEQLPETVLAYKKAHQIGRFDPAAPEIQDRKVKELWKEVEAKHIQVGARCRLSEESTRRGSIAFVGPVGELPGAADGPWVGVALDEPTGKNDGSVKGKRYFECERNRGIFVRANRVEVGNFEALALEEEDPDMEEM